MNRVWTYIISVPLGDIELDQLLKAGQTFIEHWSAHENKLSGSFQIFKKRIIVVHVNEDIAGASGCSIDKLMRFIKVTETMFGIELLNRFLIAYNDGENLSVVHSSKIKTLLETGILSENSIIFNTSVGNETEFKNWEQPLKDTWLSKYLTKV